MSRQTMQTTTVFVEGHVPSPWVVVPAGTFEDDIDPAVRDKITNPRIFERPFGFEEPSRVDDDVPERLEDCDDEQLRQIAAANGVELGRLKSRASIIATLRESGVDPKE